MNISNFLSPFYALLFRSKGVKRSIASLCAVLLGLVPYVPALQPYAELIAQIGALFGVSGLVVAGAAEAGMLPKK